MGHQLGVVVLVVGSLLAGAGCLPRDVGTLASDAYAGRDHGTAGGVKARNWIVDQLAPITAGANTKAAGRARYVQPFSNGLANVVAVIRGTELPGEYVVVGAHYDHLGTRCRTADPTDHICNGATDNAAGVAATLQVARQLAKDPPRRSVVVALWDGEEERFLGSTYYVQHPLVPLAKTVAYVNADILGANLVPTLRTTTFAVGAETGGARLSGMVDHLDESSKLDIVSLPTIFGKGFSDQGPFVDAKVPSVFFGDSSGGCYHTAQDETSVVDYPKLEQQARTESALVRNLANTHTVPHFSPGTPLATFDDVLAYRTGVSERSWPDRTLFSTADQATMKENRDLVNKIVAAGRAAFDDQDAVAFLLAAQDSSDLLEHLVCNGFLAPAPGGK